MYRTSVIPEWTKKNPVIQNEERTLDPTRLLTSWWERYLVVEQQASTHIKWFTHKNPYGCWICDLLQMTRHLLNPQEVKPDISAVKQASMDGLEDLVGTDLEDTTSDGLDGISDDDEEEDEDDDIEEEEEDIND